MAKGQRSKQQLYLLTVVISSLSTSLLITFRFTTKLTLAGTLQLDLTALIKPASSARSCKLPDTTNPAPTPDLFKQKRCYGWWSTSSLKTGTLRDTVGTLHSGPGGVFSESARNGMIDVQCTSQTPQGVQYGID